MTESERLPNLALGGRSTFPWADTDKNLQYKTALPLADGG